LILIFSIENDPSTSETMRWLRHLGAKDVVRINSDQSTELLPQLYMDEKSFTLKTKEFTINMSGLSAVWYRKGSFWFKDFFPQIDIPGHGALTRNINSRTQAENLRIREYFHHLINKNVRTLGSVRAATPNKLITLDIAQDVGLLIPEFFISNCRETFESRLENGDAIVTKPVSDGIYLWDTEEAQRGYFSYTERLSTETIATYDASLPPSFAQKEIIKDFELRVFFLNGKTHSVAIFSQSDRRTKTDYRKYNYDQPNRYVPYELPVDVNGKLCKLFERLELNTGSADMIVDTLGQYYFLEINPTGQFGALSEVCNYNLEKHIAEWLIGDNYYG